MKIIALIMAAGKGTRMGYEKNKLLIKTGKKTILENTVEKFLNNDLIDEIVVVTAFTDINEVKELFLSCKKPVSVTEGAETRTKSVLNGLKSIQDDCDIVLIHDGARPFVSENIIKCCIDEVKCNKSAITAVPVIDTIKRVNADFKITSSIEREDLYSIQTPQGFFYKDILSAYLKIKDNETFTDDSSVYEKYISSPYICMGETTNTKITYNADLKLFTQENEKMRCGIGYDSHRFVEGRKLILGGTNIPFEKGLSGHSDADALTHAIIDSIFSACGLGDIGTYFPDTLEKYKDADSIELLKACISIIKEKGLKLCSLSAVINCQKPKLATYIFSMKTNIAKAVGLDIEKIGISAKTNEGMGFSGREEGIFVIANCLVEG